MWLVRVAGCRMLGGGWAAGTGGTTGCCAHAHRFISGLALLYFRSLALWRTALIWVVKHGVNPPHLLL